MAAGVAGGGRWALIAARRSIFTLTGCHQAAYVRDGHRPKGAFRGKGSVGDLALGLLATTACPMRAGVVQPAGSEFQVSAPQPGYYKLTRRAKPRTSTSHVPGR